MITSKYKLPNLDEYLAIDCEFVGSKRGNELAKVGIVNYQGSIIFESFVYVNPRNVIDYRTSKSRIRAKDLEGAPTYEKVIIIIKDILKNKIIIGHTLFNDLNVIGYKISYDSFRDTALYIPLRRKVGINKEGIYPSLSNLSKKNLGIDIQQNEHDPIEDARSTMAIFMKVRENYEIDLIQNKDCISGIPS
ncbi:uncharacterized protein I206_103801 [Kwoniella pini CBS 10737]|uniref:Exonuclease domain-containing protein n=1 Tax=Kwoniella pini CBS 10737 TaxID=1296096 RepID=A0A1B9HSM2_9TREE|nr:uncharacterized protein I206_07750 [Kwoniella pini CBS 10737]OCF46273.1 hypothetical protein I206_07750 [Kwoniella pini CBS 10737]